MGIHGCTLWPFNIAMGKKTFRSMIYDDLPINILATDLEDPQKSQTELDRPTRIGPLLSKLLKKGHS